MRNLKIKYKFLLVFALIIFLNIFSVLYAYINIDNNDEELNTNVAYSMNKLETLLIMDKSANILGITLLSEVNSNQKDFLKFLLSHKQEYSKALDDSEVKTKDLIINSKADEDSKKVELDKLKVITDQRNLINGHFAKLSDLYQNMDFEGANSLINTTILPDWEIYNKSIKELVIYYEKSFDNSIKSINSDNKLLMMTLMIQLIIVISLIMLAFVFISKVITKPIEAILHTSQEIATGVFNVRNIKDHKYNEDEIGKLEEAIDTMKLNLVNIIDSIATNSSILENTSEEISSANIDLSERTERQAASLEETAATMEELSVTVTNTSENSKQANSMSQKLVEQSNSGALAVKEVSIKVQSIKDSSHKIEEIISLIDNIAFQTNILALNAAVEAARAGEHGRGFAVVATEVRTLSQRSAQAAKEIKELILNSTKVIDDSAVFTKKVEEQISSISVGFRNVSALIDEITVAASEQANSISQLHQVITDMDQATQQNAALVEESSATTLSLKQQSSDLNHVINKFVIKK